MSNRTTALILLMLTAALIFRVLVPRPEIIDIHAFKAAGTVAYEHGLAAVYDEATMAAMERALSGDTGYLPWSYPPTATVFTLPLAFVPAMLAQLILGLVALGGTVWFAHKHASDDAQRNIVVAMIAAPLTLNIIGGQLGALFSLMLAMGLASSRPHWFFLAALKPHLMIGPAVASLFGRRLFSALAIAGVATLAFFLSIHLYDPNALPGWREAIRYSQQYLETGQLPLGRAVSAYAFFRTWLPAGPALAIHLVIAAGVMAYCLWVLKKLSASQKVVPIAVAAMVISPYMHDYDMVFPGLALALIGRPLVANSMLFGTVAAAGMMTMLTQSQPLYKATGVIPPIVLLLIASVILIARHAAGQETVGERPAMLPAE